MADGGHGDKSMDKTKVTAEELKVALAGDIDRLAEKMATAMNAAKAGRIIADSEERVRGVHAEFRQQAFEQALRLLQDKQEAFEVRGHDTNSHFFFGSWARRLHCGSSGWSGQLDSRISDLSRRLPARLQLRCGRWLLPPEHIESNNDPPVAFWLGEVLHILPVAHRPPAG